MMNLDFNVFSFLAGQILSADILFTALEDRKVPRKPVNINTEANNLSVSVNTDKAKDEGKDCPIFCKFSLLQMKKKIFQ